MKIEESQVLEISSLFTDKAKKYREYSIQQNYYEFFRINGNVKLTGRTGYDYIELYWELNERYIIISIREVKWLQKNVIARFVINAKFPQEFVDQKFLQYKNIFDEFVEIVRNILKCPTE